jgi:cytochrome c2
VKRSASPSRLALVAVISLVLVCASGCRSAGQRALDEARLRVGGDPARGATLIQHYGCGGCHRIPGVAGAAGRSAPSLEYLPQEAYISGNLPNTPENVIRWIRSPRSVRPQTRMPELGIGTAEARDITTYLWSLR